MTPANNTISPSSNYRWKVCILLFFATTINYVDRHVLGILAPQLQKDFGWSESDYGLIVTAFQVAYAIGFLFMGNLVDRIGSRRSYMLSISTWSAATMLHSVVSSAFGFGMMRFILGLGESGNFPAAVKATSEWFSPKDRSLANGIFVSGASVGAIVAPLIVPWIAIHYGWQWAFMFTGMLGFLWLICWIAIYRSPAGSTNSVARKVKWSQLLKFRQTWAFAVAKFFTDPVFAFFFFFLPKFFFTKHGLTIDKIGLPIMVIYIVSDGGSIVGGWLSSFFIRRGWSINKSRKTTMLIAALCVTPVYFASIATNLWVAVTLIGFALAAHQAWSANLFTLPSDMFPQDAVGSVVGIGSTAGAIGGMFAATFAGFLLESTGGNYEVLFLVAGCAYLVALTLVHLLVPQLKQADFVQNTTANEIH